MTNHAPHMKILWKWFDVPAVDYYMWSHQDVYIKHFNFRVNKPGDSVKIITCMDGEIQRVLRVCPALRADLRAILS